MFFFFQSKKKSNIMASWQKCWMVLDSRECVRMYTCLCLRILVFFYCRASHRTWGARCGKWRSPLVKNICPSLQLKPLICYIELRSVFTNSNINSVLQCGHARPKLKQDLWVIQGSKTGHLLFNMYSVDLTSISSTDEMILNANNILLVYLGAPLEKT